MEGANITIQKAQRRECIASIDKGLSFIASTMSALAGCMMIFIAVVTCYEVVMRAFFNAPTSWVFNLSTVLIASMTMLGAAWALIQGRHIRVDVITNLLPQRSQSALEIIGNVFVTAFGILIAYGSFNLLTRAYIVKMRIIPNVPLVEWPFRAFFCFGALVLAIMGIRMVVSNVATFVSLMGKEGTDRRAWVNPVISALSFIISLVASLIVMTFQSQIAGILMLLVVLIFGGVPIFCALAFVGIFGLFVMNEPITEVARISYASLNTYALICLPLFMLGGQLLQQAKTADRLFRMANKWIGHLPGGLAVATIAACAVFSAVSGSSVATAATMGVISIPSMLSLGYPKRIVYGATAGGGLLGIMIPPSSAMIVYSSITDESIADLFIAGVVPGIILAMLFAIYVYIRSCKRVEIARQEKATWKERFMSLKGASGVIGAVLLVFGGIYGGIFTPIEASAVFVAYILIIAFASGDITLKTAKEAIAESTEGVIMIMVIIAGAVLLGHIITLSGLPTRVGDFIVGHKLSAFTVLSIIMFTWMVMGLFMDGLAIQLISLPIFYPVIKTLGVDGIWFGILLVVTIEMALITPPVGLNIYVIQGLTKAPASEVIKSVMPYFFILCIMVVMLYIWPELATWLPSTMKK